VTGGRAAPNVAAEGIDSEIARAGASPRTHVGGATIDALTSDTSAARDDLGWEPIADRDRIIEVRSREPARAFLEE
jgi:hypothetical protein